MKAVVFHSAGDIRLEDVSAPQIKQPTDAIIRLTFVGGLRRRRQFVRATDRPCRSREDASYTIPDDEPGVAGRSSALRAR
jgi:hypothetical protein